MAWNRRRLNKLIARVRRNDRRRLVQLAGDVRMPPHRDQWTFPRWGSPLPQCRIPRTMRGFGPRACLHLRERAAVRDIIEDIRAILAGRSSP